MFERERDAGGGALDSPFFRGVAVATSSIEAARGAVLGTIRRIRAWSGAVLGALQGIVAALEALGRPQGRGEAVEALETRLASLEASQARWHAEMEAQLIRAEQERKTARAAEERTRYKERRLASLDDDDEEGGELPEGYRELLAAGAGAGGPAGGVPPVQSGVGNGRKARRSALLRRKFGITD